MFPWESSVSGKETVPGPSRYQHHISGSILHGLELASAWGLISREEVRPVERAVGTFYLERSVPGPSGREIRGTMSPDEFHTGDNDLYTNILAERAARSVEPDVRFKRPQDEKGLLTYDSDGLRGYKQAAAVLAIYPLQDPEAEAQAEAMMERFSEKVTKNGPAMSDSIHATIWARLGKTEKAYETWHQSWRPFMKTGLMLFSEKRNRPVTYFTTGAAGSLQAVLYGFAGLRVDRTEPQNVPWKMEMEGGYWMSCRPNLPAEWKSIKLKGIWIGDERVNLEIPNQGVRRYP